MKIKEGQKFVCWTTISLTKRGPHTAWLCKCDCGTTKVVIQNVLKNGRSSRCRRCYLNGKRVPREFLHEIGHRFGNLEIIHRFKEDRASGPVSKYCLKCDCGNIKISPAGMVDFLKNKMCRPCALLTRGHSAHGMSHTPTYLIWEGMKRRCNNPKAPKYEYYGGKGIKVCERWNKFENFLADMGERPKGLVIDRICSDGNYEPGNCQWITAKENNDKAREIKMAQRRPYRISK